MGKWHYLRTLVLRRTPSVTFLNLSKLKRMVKNEYVIGVSGKGLPIDPTENILSL